MVSRFWEFLLFLFNIGHFSEASEVPWMVSGEVWGQFWALFSEPRVAWGQFFGVPGILWGVFGGVKELFGRHFCVLKVH